MKWYKLKHFKKLNDNDALRLFEALKAGKIINGDEWFSFQKENPKSGIHLDILSKKAKVEYINSLDNNFF